MSITSIMVVLALIVGAHMLGVVIGHKLIPKRSNSRSPMAPIEQHEPRNMAFLLRWDSTEKQWFVFPIALCDIGTYHTDLTGAKLKPRTFCEAWYEGRVYDRKADATVACNERNLMEAERLMKKAVGS